MFGGVPVPVMTRRNIDFVFSKLAIIWECFSEYSELMVQLVKLVKILNYLCTCDVWFIVLVSSFVYVEFFTIAAVNFKMLNVSETYLSNKGFSESLFFSQNYLD